MKRLIEWFFIKVLKRKKVKVYKAEHYFKGNVEVWEIDITDFKDEYI